MKKFIFVCLALLLFSIAEAKDPLVLSNDAWPPYIVEGDEQGTAEMLVCQALERSGWQCGVKVDDWDNVLNGARTGAIDGIAAAWRDSDRETYLLFSKPYLSNRIVPVVNNENPVVIKSSKDLAGLRVALVKGYAYGDEIMEMISSVDVIEAKNSTDALRHLSNGDADTALLNELVARNELEERGTQDLTIIDSVLAFRDLHFAVSRQHPMAQEIIDDFHRSYELMLADGTVNEILNVDWLATDFGQPGYLNVVMRSDVSLDDLPNPSNDSDIYALHKSEYILMRKSELDPSRVKYQADGKSYSSLQTALDSVFGKNTVCKHKNYTSTFDCTDAFKKPAQRKSDRQ